MSVNSDVNLKQMLRKIEYPLCAKEALNKIGNLIQKYYINVDSSF